MKMLVWLSKLAVSAVLISSLSVFTSWFIVNTYLKSVLDQMNINIPAKHYQFSDFLSRLSDGVHTIALSGKAPYSSDLSAAKRSDNRENEQRPPSEEEPATAADKAKEPAGDDAVAVWNQQLYERQAEQQRQDIIMSAEEFSQKKEQLTNEDKMKIFSILFSKLPQQDMQKISLIMENGITRDELKQVDRIISQHLDRSEYDQLLAILNKY
jgi:hypothetical protein